MPANKWALITGASKRIGKAISEQLHRDGYNIIIHYSQSKQAADTFCNELNSTRENSAISIQADLTNEAEVMSLIKQVNAIDTLAVLVNNAACFYATPFGNVTHQQMMQILQTNLISPYLLTQGLFNNLAQNMGSVINLIDIHALRPLKDHGLYSISKAGLATATLSMAQDMAPLVRVNGISPGAILWPNEATAASTQQIIDQIPLQRCGTAEDIAQLVSFLTTASYITGQIIAVDGGRSATGYQGASS
ncbi:pteridine reductase [Shewanella marina]|uniref:pteridine reductase n=1 Tax=Shewanella marina TaxID=487319 RepID=UPI00047288A0|nr:pteridine reductase [Shewanella marina]